MARQTRAQRRARREQMTPGSEAALPGGPPAPPRRPTARAAARPEPAREPRAALGSGVRGFVAESWAELKKVEWPSRSQVVQGTVVVIIACIIVGTY
ncbi:MAG: preprotein translocase subunit SecE, partial [Gaiellaceae bacterium]